MLRGAIFGGSPPQQNKAAAGIFRGGNFLSGLTTFQVFQDLDSNFVTRFRWFCTWFFRTPVNKLSMDDRIKTGFQDLMGFRLFKGLDVQGFQFSDAWILAFRILIWVLLLFVGYWFFSELDLDWFFGSDRFRLLIQRWKNAIGWRNLFDKGGVWPDESTRAPGEGYDRGFAWRSSEDEGLCPTNGSAA